MITINCKTCNKPVKVKEWQIRRGGGKFCSKLCANRAIALLRKKEDSSCVNCGGLFHAIGTKRRFCKPDCWIKYRTEHGLGRNTGTKWDDKARLNGSVAQKKRFETETPYNKGKKLPNRSGANHHYYGLKRSEETKRKISETRKGKAAGKDSPFWKGGITTENQKQRIAFSKLTPLIFQRDNFTCQMCSQYGGYLHADHIKPWVDYPDLRLDIDNCRTLCVACHYFVTWKRKMPIGSRWGLHGMTRERG